MKSIEIFSYGSNSLCQLQGRIKSLPFLTNNRPAILYDYERIFWGSIGHWGGGGVASLYKLDGAKTFGSLLTITPTQLDELSIFERGYSLHKITCTDLITFTSIDAVTYISDLSIYTSPPSLQYLTAIHHHLSEVNLSPSFPIVGYTSNGDRLIHQEQWSIPSSIYEFNLPAFIVHINILWTQRGCDSWPMPMTIQTILHTLQVYNIHTIYDLKEHFMSAEKRGRLLSDITQFCSVTEAVIDSVLYE